MEAFRQVDKVETLNNAARQVRLSLTSLRYPTRDGLYID